eukprot:g3731.t1
MLLGAFVIFLGVLVELSPSVIGALRHEGETNGTNGFWAIVFASSQLPAALCSIYQEQAFTQGVRVNVVYMMAWSSLAQFIMLFFAIPFDFLPGFGTTTASGFGREMHDAWKCVLDDLEGHPECKTAGFTLFCCIATMLFTNVFQALLVKHSSAALSVLVMTLITPVSTFCFTLPSLMGKEYTEKMSNIQIIALGILMVGVSLYRYADVMSNERGKSRGESLLEGSDSDVSLLGLASSLSNGEDRRYIERGRTVSEPYRRRRSRMMAEFDPALSAKRPLLMATRCGIINSEYTAGDEFTGTRRREVSILYEGTLWEATRAPNFGLNEESKLESGFHDYTPLSTSAPVK